MLPKNNTKIITLLTFFSHNGGIANKNLLKQEVNDGKP